MIIRIFLCYDGQKNGSRGHPEGGHSFYIFNQWDSLMPENKKGFEIDVIQEKSSA